MTNTIGANAEKIIHADHHDPFSYLGLHKVKGGYHVRAFFPDAEKLSVIDPVTGERIAESKPIHPSGLFDIEIKDRTERFTYRFRAWWNDTEHEFEDPYRFGAILGELDRHLLSEGTHYKTYEKLGAHTITVDGIDGVLFSVWAPNARRVSVVGDFNDWDGRRHSMRVHADCGIWEIFVPGVDVGALYKFEIKSQDGTIQPLKADPYALYMEQAPGTASIVHDLDGYKWSDNAWMTQRIETVGRDMPMSIYEVHLGSWRRKVEENARPLTYRELADELIPYVKELGFTHIELLPVSEFPFDGSWGYQPIGLFAPTSRFGEPNDFRYFVDQCHNAGLGVIIDWVVGHFPEDSHGLVHFDGTHLYEHSDPRLGRHSDWGTLIYNFGRTEVANYLLSNALYWMDAFHIDGLRVDAVASMLYLDYSREEGQWIPNEYGGNENLEAIHFLKRLNELVYEQYPGTFTIAEESTAWPMVSRPTYIGGLGFGFKWNMGWMHDTLRFISRDPIYRQHHFDDMTFGLLYAFHENFVLPISHDEVVHGKRSLIDRMPGDLWQQFANLRLYLSFMYAHPGKKLLFMGAEFGQRGEWNHNQSLEWHLLEHSEHRGIQALVAKLNELYLDHAPLHAMDHEHTGFAWIECHDREQSVLSFRRIDPNTGREIIVLCNFTPEVRYNYRHGMPTPGQYAEIFNSDSAFFGGSNTGNGGSVTTEDIPAHGLNCSAVLTVPPLAVIMLEQRKN